MFNTKLQATFVAAAIAIGTLLTANAPASAESRLRVDIGGPNIQVGIGHRRGRGWDRGDRWDQGDRWDRRNRCSPRKALRKARRRGLRRAYVVRVGHRGVVVKGRKWGDRVVMGFDRSRKCRIRFVSGR